MELQDRKAQAPGGEEAKILERLARIISSVRGVKPDYAHLAAELEPALPFDIFGIVLLRYDREAVRVTVCQRSGEGWRASYHQHPLADSMLARISASLGSGGLVAGSSYAGGEIVAPIVAADVYPSPGLFVQNFPDGVTGLPSECGDALCAHPHIRGILIAPLIAGGSMLGTLELGSDRLNAYTDPALQRLITAIARVLATAIEVAQVGGNVEIQDRQRAELKDVSTALTTAVDLPMILDRIVLGITNALHVSSAIVRFDQRRHRYCLEAQSGLDATTLQKMLDQENVLSRQEIIGAALLTHLPQVSQDIGRDERFPQSQGFATHLAVSSLFCYPLIIGKYIYGSLLLLSPEPGGFTPLKTDIFTLFASQATIAIHNGMLLQSAQERRHFQEIIEQFERAQQQNVFGSQDDPDEQDMLKRLREETMSTFGLSLGSVLRFISDHLLTRSERHLQDILRTSNARTSEGKQPLADGLCASEQPSSFTDEALFLAQLSDIGPVETATSHEGMAYLMQAAKTALADTGFLKDMSAALMRALRIDETHPHAYEHLKRELSESWFIVDLDGSCVYLNRAAKIFCEMSVDLEKTSNWSRWPEVNQALFNFSRPTVSGQETVLTLDQTLATLLPRIRQLKEVLAYMRGFVVAHSEDGLSKLDESALHGQESMVAPTVLRCTISAEALPGQTAILSRQPVHIWSGDSEPHLSGVPPLFNHISSSPTMLLDSSPSDRHYQFIRHALYNEYGQWFANALHIHDVTEQVHDEKNKAVLLASVSHDLRTPLTTIKAAVTGLLEADVVWDEETRREFLEEIDAETDHLSSQVNALVEMSRIAMGALVLDKEWCDIVELVHATLTRSQRMLADFIVQIKVHSPLPLISADYAQLERVLYNLLENAARHSPKKTEIQIVVDISTSKELPSVVSDVVSHWVRVRVIDQGPGVPVEERDRIFKSFYSLDAQGNGLGLAICRGIIEAHQGSIWVEGNADEGSSFVFILPITS
jgi:signal transduction histidine kinase/GAF domain-containing protein